MRPVNLLPARYRPARATGERAGIAYAVLGVLAVLFLMVLLYVLTQNGINDAKSKTEKAQAEQQAAQARIGQLGPYGQFASLKQQRESAVMQIAEQRFDWERLMRETALLLPHDVYLTSFGTGAGAATAPASSAPSGGPTITLQGCAPSHDAVATTMVRLRSLHSAQDVELASSAKSGSGAPGTTTVCAVTWNATVTLASEAPATATAQVPARLGGGP